MSDLDDTKQYADGSVSGVALALSGGGYRAMMYHAGSLVRLNEVGLLAKLACISSVSGGSITAGALALSWNDLVFKNGVAQNFQIVIERIRAMAETSIDVGAVIGGILLPGSISDRVSEAYDRVLFKEKMLADLPDEAAGSPRFVLNATNVQTAALWRFSRTYMGDYRVGLVASPAVALAKAVAASSAFPPILSPLTLPITQPVKAMAGNDLHHAPYTEQAVLSDGGVYDNLGLETVKRYKTLLISDGGQKIEAEEAPHHDWANHAIRILSVVDNQVRSLRKRALIKSFDSGEHNGCYWGIRSSSADTLSEDPLGVKTRDPSKWAAVPTRLEKMPRDVQDGLMNWGYASCDAAIRMHLDQATQTQLGIAVTAPTGFPNAGAY